MPFFDQVAETPEDPIFGLIEAFEKDPRPEKLTLIIGSYRDDRLRPTIMKAVKEAEKRILEKEKDKEYLPIFGDFHEIEDLGNLIFGERVWKEERIVGVQSVGGTGALRIGADFLRMYSNKKVVISDPSWPNHQRLFTRAGFEVETYPYYDRVKRCLEIEKMIAALKKLPERTVVIFHLSCHNPSGIDLSYDVWKDVAQVTLERQLIPFFDCAYQGFGRGLEEDVRALIPFEETGQEFLLAYSCSKNFSLYCERTGALYVSVVSKEEKRNVFNALKALIRTSVSNPPAHGARIVDEILEDSLLRQVWKDELNSMRNRIVSMRKSVAAKFSMPEIKEGNGMFAFLNITPAQVEYLRKEKAIYIVKDGRINLSGLNESAILRLYDALS